MTKADVVGIINKADGAAPGRYEGCMRATVPTMLRAALEHKGGLRRIAAAAASRARARAKATQAFLPTVESSVETWFVPLLAKVRPMARDKNKRVKDNYRALKALTKTLRYGGGGLSKQELVTHLSKAKTAAKRVDAAYDRAMRTIDRRAAAKAVTH